MPSTVSSCSHLFFSTLVFICLFRADSLTVVHQQLNRTRTRLQLELSQLMGSIGLLEASHSEMRTKMIATAGKMKQIVSEQVSLDDSNLNLEKEKGTAESQLQGDAAEVVEEWTGGLGLS